MRVILDTCVLVPAVIREMIVSIAFAGYITPLWSKRILKEWEGVFRKKDPQLFEQTKIEIVLLNHRFSNSCVEIKDSLERILFLPDLDDRHVLAAAIEGQADLIITQNIRDFPKRILLQFGLLAKTPDNLFLEIHRKDPLLIEQIIKRLHEKTASHNYQLKTQKSFLKRAGLPRLAKIIL